MKILIAIDGSPNALRALQAALDLSARLATPASLGLITVHDDTALKSASRVLGSQAVRDYLSETADEQLKSAVALAGSSGLAYEKIVGTGPIAPTIVAEAAARGYDLVILGTKGRSGLQDWLIGSVAQRVSANCSVPVMLVK